MCHLGTWMGGDLGTGNGGLDDPRGFFQPNQFCDSDQDHELGPLCVSPAVLPPFCSSLPPQGHCLIYVQTRLYIFSLNRTKDYF